MRGELHRRLVTQLNEALAAGKVKQESLASVLDMHQTTVSGILRRDAGTLDLDEAAAALELIGSSLPAFLAGQPPRTLTPIEQLVRGLLARRSFVPFVQDLLAVPRAHTAAVLAAARGAVYSATGRLALEKTGRRTGTAPAARRTTRPGGPRREGR